MDTRAQRVYSLGFAVDQDGNEVTTGTGGRGKWHFKLGRHNYKLENVKNSPEFLILSRNQHPPREGIQLSPSFIRCF